MTSPRPSRAPRWRTPARLLLSTAALAAGLIGTAGVGSAASSGTATQVGNGGNVPCPAGTTLLAKFEYGAAYRLAEGDRGVVTVTDGTAQGGSFTSTQPIGAVIVKGSSTDAVVTFHDPSVLVGTFGNTGLVNGGGNVPAVSNVTFCLGAPIVPTVVVPTDVCSNVDGVQVVVPVGMVAAADGSCAARVVVPTDVCSNIEGTQADVPAGMVAGADGSCAARVVVPTDVCSNIEGTQADVPAGMVVGRNGTCAAPVVDVVVVPTIVVPTDVCSNIAGLQAEAPEGTTSADGTCTAPVVAGVVITQPVAAQPEVARPAVLEPVLPQVAATPAAPLAAAQPTSQVLGVTVSRPAGAATQLPRTGGDSTAVAALGAGMLLAGAAMVATSRRRSAAVAS